MVSNKLRNADKSKQPPAAYVRDKKPRMGEPKILTVFLPGGEKVLYKCDSRCPMMDLLVQITSIAKLKPTGYEIQPLSHDADDATVLPFNPNTQIGAIDTQVVRIAPRTSGTSKYRLNKAADHSQTGQATSPNGSANFNTRVKDFNNLTGTSAVKICNDPRSMRQLTQPVIPSRNNYIASTLTPLVSGATIGTSCRVRVRLPREQIHVIRAVPQYPLQELFDLVCDERQLSPSRHVLVYTDDISRKVDLRKTLHDCGTTELTMKALGESSTTIVNVPIRSQHSSNIFGFLKKTSKKPSSTHAHNNGISSQGSSGRSSRTSSLSESNGSNGTIIRSTETLPDNKTINTTTNNVQDFRVPAVTKFPLKIPKRPAPRPPSVVVTEVNNEKHDSATNAVAWRDVSESAENSSVPSTLLRRHSRSYIPRAVSMGALDHLTQPRAMPRKKRAAPTPPMGQSHEDLRSSALFDVQLCDRLDNIQERETKQDETDDTDPVPESPATNEVSTETIVQHKRLPAEIKIVEQSKPVEVKLGRDEAPVELFVPDENGPVKSILHEDGLSENTIPPRNVVFTKENTSEDQVQIIVSRDTLSETIIPTVQEQKNASETDKQTTVSRDTIAETIITTAHEEKDASKTHQRMAVSRDTLPEAKIPTVHEENNASKTHQHITDSRDTIAETIIPTVHEERNASKTHQQITVSRGTIAETIIPTVHEERNASKTHQHITVSRDTLAETIIPNVQEERNASKTHQQITDLRGTIAETIIQTAHEERNASKTHQQITVSRDTLAETIIPNVHEERNASKTHQQITDSRDILAETIIPTVHEGRNASNTHQKITVSRDTLAETMIPTVMEPAEKLVNEEEKTKIDHNANNYYSRITLDTSHMNVPVVARIPPGAENSVQSSQNNIITKRIEENIFADNNVFDSPSTILMNINKDLTNYSPIDMEICTPITNPYFESPKVSIHDEFSPQIEIENNIGNFQSQIKDQNVSVEDISWEETTMDSSESHDAEHYSHTATKYVGEKFQIEQNMPQSDAGLPDVRIHEAEDKVYEKSDTSIIDLCSVSTDEEMYTPPRRCATSVSYKPVIIEEVYKSAPVVVEMLEYKNKTKTETVNSLNHIDHAFVNDDKRSITIDNVQENNLNGNGEDGSKCRRNTYVIDDPNSYTPPPRPSIYTPPKFILTTWADDKRPSNGTWGTEATVDKVVSQRNSGPLNPPKVSAETEPMMNPPKIAPKTIPKTAHALVNNTKESPKDRVVPQVVGVIKRSPIDNNNFLNGLKSSTNRTTIGSESELSAAKKCLRPVRTSFRNESTDSPTLFESAVDNDKKAMHAELLSHFAKPQPSDVTASRDNLKHTTAPFNYLISLPNYHNQAWRDRVPIMKPVFGKHLSMKDVAVKSIHADCQSRTNAPKRAVPESPPSWILVKDANNAIKRNTSFGENNK